MIFDHFGQSSQVGKSSRTGIQLLGIMLANGMPPYDSETAEDVEERKLVVCSESLVDDVLVLVSHSPSPGDFVVA